MLLQILDKFIVIGTFINERKLNFHSLLTDLAMHIELQRISFVISVENMLELGNEPSFQTFPMDVPGIASTGAWTDVIIFVVLLL